LSIPLGSAARAGAEPADAGAGALAADVLVDDAAGAPVVDVDDDVELLPELPQPARATSADPITRSDFVGTRYLLLA
jgi:hypothetical protein